MQQISDFEDDDVYEMKIDYDDDTENEHADLLQILEIMTLDLM